MSLREGPASPSHTSCRPGSWWLQESKDGAAAWSVNSSVRFTVGIATDIPLYYSSTYSIIHLLVHIFLPAYIMWRGRRRGLTFLFFPLLLGSNHFFSPLYVTPSRLSALPGALYCPLPSINNMKTLERSTVRLAPAVHPYFLPATVSAVVIRNPPLIFTLLMWWPVVI